MVNLADKRPCFGGQAQRSHVLTARAAVLVALDDNPGLAAMQHRYEALQEVPSQVGSLPDPMVNVNAMNFPTDSFDRDQEGMTQLQLGFSQVVPFPRKAGSQRGSCDV